MLFEHGVLILYLIEMPFNNFANRADLDQADDQGKLCLLMGI